MTRYDAERAQHGQIFEHVSLKNSDGTPTRCRVNGKIRTWKTRDHWELPVKHGLKHCFYITPDNASEWIPTF